ncbi:MAG TPA: GNAT family N-acetyltransferase [Actinomycetes bacterium]
MALAIPPSPPELRGDGVLLTPWEEDDLPAIVELADDVGRHWSRSLADVRTVDDARRWLAERGGPDRLDWAVRDPDSRALLGRVSLHRFEEHPPGAEIGYGVHPAHRRRGVAVSATDTVLGYAFGDLRLDRVELVHDVGNVASCVVATRGGFALEGVERGALGYPDGRVSDQHRHARLAEDPPGPADPPAVPLDVPVLDDDDLLLRPWRDDDARDYLVGVGDPSVARWSPHPPPRTTDDARRLLARTRRRAADGTAVAWAVEVAGEVAGAVALRSINRVDLWATASYWTMPRCRGRGVAPRALTAASGYAFDGLGLHRVELQHAVTNAASCRVAVKAGFALEGTQRESCLLADGFVDEHLHARLRP